MSRFVFFFFFNDTATTEIYTLSLHDALPIWRGCPCLCYRLSRWDCRPLRSEEHTSELQSLRHLVCRLLLEKKTTPAHSAQKITNPNNNAQRTNHRSPR